MEHQRRRIVPRIAGAVAVCEPRGVEFPRAETDQLARPLGDAGGLRLNGLGVGMRRGHYGIIAAMTARFKTPCLGLFAIVAFVLGLVLARRAARATSRARPGHGKRDDPAAAARTAGTGSRRPGRAGRWRRISSATAGRSCSSASRSARTSAPPRSRCWRRRASSWRTCRRRAAARAADQRRSRTRHAARVLKAYVRFFERPSAPPRGTLEGVQQAAARIFGARSPRCPCPAAAIRWIMGRAYFSWRPPAPSLRIPRRRCSPT